MKLCKRHFLTAAALLLSFSLAAQTQGPPPDRPAGTPPADRPAPPEMRSPEEMAREEAEQMQREVGLDKKQYKKVYNLLKKDYQYRQDAARQQFGGGMPPQDGFGGGPGGVMGGPGGGMGGPGGGMGGPGGGMGGPGGGGGMPPQGDMPQGARPENGGGMGGPEGGFGGGPGPGSEVITYEYLEKQDNKLKKILTSEQYSKWRSSHPAEHLQLPPLDFGEQ